MRFADLKIRTRFTLLLALFVVSFTIIGLWSFKTLSELKVNGPLYQHIVQSKDLTADILPPPNYIIESYLVTLQLAASQDPAEQNRLISGLKTLHKEYQDRHEYWKQQRLEEPLNGQFLKKSFEPAVAFYKTAFDELIPAIERFDQDRVHAISARLKEHYTAHRREIDEVVRLAAERSKKDEEHAADRISSASWLMLLILALSLGAAVGVAAIIIRSIMRPLNEALTIAQSVAAGDLTQRIETTARDETGQLLRALKEMNDSLAKIVNKVRGGTEAINDASGQIATGNLDLSSRTEEQASSLEETASSIEELTTTVRHNADNAVHANQLARTASEVAMKGGTVVSEVVNTMGSINDSAKKIVDIISVIDGIAFQTNILALNAAVEAARAGEQGRGFAVVAAEVRNLAQRSASAAKEIKLLISDSVEKVNVGAKLVDQAGSTMNEVVESVRRVTEIIGDIAAASREQTSGIEQVNSAITQMDQTTQQNAALVEQAATASESLQHQAAALSDLVRIFKISASETNTAEAAARPSARSTHAARPQVAGLSAPPKMTANRPMPKQVASQPEKHDISRLPSHSGDNWEEF
jgi:methyl-accepting chemotaxis protein